MSTITIHAVMETDGELHLRNLPYHKGDRVEAVIQIHHKEEGEAQRDAARQRFLEHSKKSQFRSVGPYPSRDELHERR